MTLRSLLLSMPMVFSSFALTVYADHKPTHANGVCGGLTVPDKRVPNLERRTSPPLSRREPRAARPDSRLRAIHGSTADYATNVDLARIGGDETLVGPAVVSASPKDLLRWYDHTIDPANPTRGIPGNYLIRGYPQGAIGYYLVQLNGPVTLEHRVALESSGATLLDYVPGYAFVVTMDAATCSRVSALKMVRWVGIYQPGYRIDRALRDGRFEGLWPAALRSGWPLELTLPPARRRGRVPRVLSLVITWFAGVDPRAAASVERCIARARPRGA